MVETSFLERSVSVGRSANRTGAFALSFFHMTGILGRDGGIAVLPQRRPFFGARTGFSADMGFQSSSEAGGSAMTETLFLVRSVSTGSLSNMEGTTTSTALGLRFHRRPRGSRSGFNG
jgi:hypothetical protein